jgi:phytoene dehydrogenase-like protein
MISRAPRVVIIGAGMAGLACARRLAEYGVPSRLLEASDTFGGRVRTTIFDGYRLNHGFQILLTGYAEAKRVLDYRNLRLQPFRPGALVWWQGKLHRLSDPFRAPQDFVSTLVSPIGTLPDKLRVLRLRRDACAGRISSRAGGPSAPTHAVLTAYGFSDSIIDRFFRPLLRGVFLDDRLTAPAWIFEQVWGAFSRGVAALPHDGMAAIARQLAAQLPPDHLQCHAEVAELADTTVRMTSGERLSAETVVLATDYKTAARLQGVSPPAEGRSSVTLYYAAPTPPVEGPWLVLNGEAQGPVNHLCVVSEVAPSYAPRGDALIAVSLRPTTPADTDAYNAAVRRQLSEWFGTQPTRWRHLRTDCLDAALPPLDLLESHRASSMIRPGLFRCGDYLHNGTLEGALLSGRMTAEEIICQYGLAARSETAGYTNR